MNPNQTGGPTPAPNSEPEKVSDKGPDTSASQTTATAGGRSSQMSQGSRSSAPLREDRQTRLPGSPDNDLDRAKQHLRTALENIEALITKYGGESGDEKRRSSDKKR